MFDGTVARQSWLCVYDDVAVRQTLLRWNGDMVTGCCHMWSVSGDMAARRRLLNVCGGVLSMGDGQHA